MTQVKCPNCGKLTRWSQQNAFRPFCSERCKMIDLGAWASDRYVVSGGPAEQAEETPATEATPSKH